MGKNKKKKSRAPDKNGTASTSAGVPPTASQASVPTSAPAPAEVPPYGKKLYKGKAKVTAQPSTTEATGESSSTGTLPKRKSQEPDKNVTALRSAGVAPTASQGSAPALAPAPAEVPPYSKNVYNVNTKATAQPSTTEATGESSSSGTLPRGVGDAGVRAITRGLNVLKIPPRKPGGAGTKGRLTTIETNHFALDLGVCNKTAIHYDVAMKPDVPKRLLRSAMEAMRQKHFPNCYPGYDGKKNLVYAYMLPFGQFVTDTVTVTDGESTRGKEFEVTINFAAEVDLSVLKNYMNSGTSLDAPQTAIQMLDIILRSAPSLNFVQVGRSFFTPPTGRVVDLGGGLEMWLGVFQSVSLGWKPFVNVDVAHKGFPKSQNVVDLMYELFQDIQKGLNKSQRNDFNKYIKDLKIEYEIPRQPNTRRTYRVNGAVDIPGNMRFTLDSGEISVLEYYKRDKRYQIQCPELPCLHVGSLARTNPIYLPPELCKITAGQVTMRKMSENQTSRMIKEAATNTVMRKRKIMAAFTKANFNGNPCIQDFGLSVSGSFEKIDARILDPPSLSYGQGTVTPDQGKWKANKFLEGKKLSSWTILSLDKYTRPDDIRKFANQLIGIGKTLGMAISEPVPLTTALKAPSPKFQLPADFNRACQDLEGYLRSCKGMELVFVVVPDKGEAYAKVKQLAELKVGVLTQCINCRTMNRMNSSTVNNILLKVNSKLNGINHTFCASIRPKCLKVPAMVVGADVTHPSPDMERIPSVAAVCASHDPKGFQYNIQYRLQPAHEEIIRDLQEIMKEHMIFFREKTTHKPKHILFYRDGVGEGQFSQVLNSELQAIRAACASLNVNFKPMITFLVVQKRHHTRFFPTCGQDENGKNKNVPPGTIVDTTITHPTELDFYLVSHASIQGVSRPTKYRCLWDDANMSEDDLEELTYFLCHMFSRCTRSVSYPAPTYYAHLAAYRARVYIDGMQIMDSEIHFNQQLAKAKEEFVKSSPMFFV